MAFRRAKIEDGDVLEIRAWPAESARGGCAPARARAFLECHTYRWREHVGPGEDYEAGYRTRDELEPWQKSDQVELVGRSSSPADRAAIDAAIESEIAAAVDFAETSPFPALEGLTAHVFAQ